MGREQFDATALARYRQSPIAFIEHVLCDPETGKPFVLSEAERQFLQHAFTLNEDGKLVFPELVFGAIKKVGKNNSRCDHHAHDDSDLWLKVRRRLLCSQRL